LKYRIAGKEKLLAIGSYPEVSGNRGYSRGAKALSINKILTSYYMFVIMSGII